MSVTVLFVHSLIHLNLECITIEILCMYIQSQIIIVATCNRYHLCQLPIHLYSRDFIQFSSETIKCIDSLV